MIVPNPLAIKLSHSESKSKLLYLEIPMHFTFFCELQWKKLCSHYLLSPFCIPHSIGDILFSPYRGLNKNGPHMFGSLVTREWLICKCGLAGVRVVLSEKTIPTPESLSLFTLSADQDGEISAAPLAHVLLRLPCFPPCFPPC